MNFKSEIVKLVYPSYSFLINFICRCRYRIVLSRLRSKIRKGISLKVVFLVNEISKWKAQSLYELFLKDNNFVPVIGLTFADVDWELSSEERSLKRKALITFFSERRMPVIEYCSDIDGKLVFNKIDADIVFYQQPWKLHRSQRPENISHYALTCYFPYYVPNYCIMKTSCESGFHYKLWRYYHLSQQWVDALNNEIPKYKRAVKIVATGHPMLDYINNHSKDVKLSQKTVIYAPHWSVYSELQDNDEKYSTFQYLGKDVLNYAKSHLEYHWYFKPHPTLKTSLIRTGLMTERDVDAYYSEWSKIGEVCISGDYKELFWHSSLMITDCASFLVEYPCTGNPLIHLISSACTVPIPDPSIELFDSFYKVRNKEEMKNILNLILEKGEDPQKNIRLQAVKNAGLLEANASNNILNDLRKSLNIKSNG